MLAGKNRIHKIIAATVIIAFSSLLIGSQIPIKNEIDLTSALQEYEIDVEVQEGDLIVLVGRTLIGIISKIERLSNEEQEAIIKQIAVAANYCTTKGMWSQLIALQARNEISSVNEQIAKVYKKAKGQKIPSYKLIERERIIRTAYTRGHNNPFDFGREVVGFCMLEGY